MIIGQFYKRKQLAFIYIPWKDSSLDGTNSESQELNTKDEITKSSQPPKCWRNCPALRNLDFFMDINSLSIQKIRQPKTCRDYLKIYHQNIRSIGRKTCELLSHVYPDLLHVWCPAKHHLNKMGINHVYIENYNIGAQFCRAIHEKGVVVIYAHYSLKFSNIDLSKHCKEKILKCSL
jgi:hypothetical protein